MWHSPKRLLTTGAFLVLAGTRAPAQEPVTSDQGNLPALPAPSVHLVPWTVFSDIRASAHPPVLAFRQDYQSPPLGAMMHQHFQIQVNNGIAARMILHDYDFICGGDSLNVRGSDRLRQLVAILVSCQHPLLIERTPYSPGLAEKRRAMVMSQLAEQGFAVRPELVVIGPPQAIPLRGFEADLIYLNLIQQSQRRGDLPGPGASSSGGAGTTGAMPPR